MTCLEELLFTEEEVEKFNLFVPSDEQIEDMLLKYERDIVCATYYCGGDGGGLATSVIDPPSCCCSGCCGSDVESCGTC